MVTAGDVVAPGADLGDAVVYQPGDGTYVLHNRIIASVIGTVIIDACSTSDLPVVSINRKRPKGVVPTVGDRVTARITKINIRFASTEIVCVGDRVLPEPFPAIIKAQDVRALEKDSVDIANCFRPGDIVLADVISLGDTRSYFLTTASDSLGVIVAHSSAGHPMVPVSWQQMQCPVTKALEYRKVAKPASLS